MTLISKQPYHASLDNSRIKSLVPTMRDIAITRKSECVTTADAFCAILFEQPEFLARFEESFGIDNAGLEKELSRILPEGYEAKPLDEFEEIQITPKVDAAFKRASMSRTSLTPKELLQALFQDTTTELYGFLEQINVVKWIHPTDRAGEKKVISSLDQVLKIILDEE